MSHFVRHAAGLWWKFDRYELKDGYIVPGKGARLTRYNPWANYWNARDARTRDQQQPAYASLLQLLSQVKTLPLLGTDRLEPDDDSRRAILKWCGEYGLLGLLHHVTQAVYLPGRLVKAPWAAGPVYAEYSRTPTSWRSRFHTGNRPLDAAIGWEAAWAAFSRGTAVDGDEGTVIATTTFGGGDVAPSTIAEPPWAVFFPSVPKDQRRTFAYPPPYDSAFWKLYGEPLGLFLSVAGLLREALEAFLQPKPISVLGIDVVPPLETTPHPPKDKHSDAAISRLHLLTAPVRMTLGSHKQHGLQIVWAAGSLLSAFGAMLCEDLADRRHQRCDECRRVFISNQPNVRFCSKKCLNTATKRTYRHRKQARARKKQR